MEEFFIDPECTYEVTMDVRRRVVLLALTDHLIVADHPMSPEMARAGAAKLMAGEMPLHPRHARELAKKLLAMALRAEGAEPVPDSAVAVYEALETTDATSMGYHDRDAHGRPLTRYGIETKVDLSRKLSVRPKTVETAVELLCSRGLLVALSCPETGGPTWLQIAWMGSV